MCFDHMCKIIGVKKMLRLTLITNIHVFMDIERGIGREFWHGFYNDRQVKISDMPLLTLNELENMVPLFRGPAGNLLAKGLMRVLEINKVNELYDRNSIFTGPEFARHVLEDIGITYEILNAHFLEALPDGPFITISKQPYGSIDGIMLVDILGHLRPDYKVMVNGFLSRVRTLDENFIYVTPTGEEREAPSVESIHGMREALAHIRNGHPLGIFPSGAVSDLSLKDGCVRDREWQEPVLRFIRKMHVPVLPIRFMDGNSALYYSLGLIDWRVRLLKLPSEVFNKKGRRTRVEIGRIVTPQLQDECRGLADYGRFLRSFIYKYQSV